MDKGVKGLLSGDLSIYIIQQIQTSIEKYKSKVEKICNRIDDELAKKESLEEMYNNNLKESQTGDDYNMDKIQ